MFIISEIAEKVGGLPKTKYLEIFLTAISFYVASEADTTTVQKKIMQDDRHCCMHD